MWENGGEIREGGFGGETGEERACLENLNVDGNIKMDHTATEWKWAGLLYLGIRTSGGLL